MKLTNWFDRLFYVFGPFGIAAAIYHDCPVIAAVIAFCFGNLFQIELQKWIDRQDSEAEE